MEAKLDRLLRFHRQRVFNMDGDLHERAIRRLKATPTAQAIFRRRREHSEWLAGQRLLATWA